MDRRFMNYTVAQKKKKKKKGRRRRRSKQTTKKEANNHFIAIIKGSKNSETLALESIA